MTWTWREYQTQVIEQVIEGEGKAIIALPLGAGKTAVAVEIVRRMGAKVIMVTAPINTHKGWVRHFNMLMPDLPVHIIGRTTGDDALELAKAGEPGVYIVGWEYGRGSYRYEKNADGTRKMVGKGSKKKPVISEVIREALDWSKYPLDAAIVDESARMANRKSAQAEVVHTSKDAPVKLAVSATPAGNKIEGIWSSLHWCWPDRYRYFWPWVKAFLIQRPDPFAGMVITGEKRAGMVAKDIPVYAKRTEEEVHGELPEIVTHEVEVELTPTQARIYKQFERDALAWLEANPVAAALPVTKRARMLQACLAVPSVVDEQVTFKPGAKSSKIDALVDILTDLPDDEKVLVWTHSARIVNVVVDRLIKAGHPAVAAVGGQIARIRNEALDSFTQGDAQVLVATIPTLGEGVDGLQHVCHTEVWLSLDDNLTTNRQAMGRLRRPGQAHVINRFYINATDTVEVRKAGRLESNKELLQKAGML